MDTFLHKVSDDVSSKCKILRGIVKAGIMTTFVVLSFAAGLMPVAAGTIPAVTAAGAASSSFLANAPKLTSFGINIGQQWELGTGGGDLLDNALCKGELDFKNAVKGFNDKTRILLGKELSNK
ncbi:MAG: hypothetical protein Q9170_006650 [Blastenia crenularia]